MPRDPKPDRVQVKDAADKKLRHFVQEGSQAQSWDMFFENDASVAAHIRGAAEFTLGRDLHQVDLGGAIAVCIIVSGKYRLRIYQKRASGWSLYLYTLQLKGSEYHWVKD